MTRFWSVNFVPTIFWPRNRMGQGEFLCLLPSLRAAPEDAINMEGSPTRPSLHCRALCGEEPLRRCQILTYEKEILAGTDQLASRIVAATDICCPSIHVS